MKPLAILLFSTLLAGISSAQSVKAVIVQINTSQNKISYFYKTGNPKEAARIASESTEMSKKMIADFNDNFIFCPVYFCIDSNIDLIKNKQFKNILLNADLVPLSSPIITSTDSDYLIVRYGYPDDNTTIRNTKGITVYYSDFTQLFFVHKHEPDQKDRKYVYISGKYDIEYYPIARELNRRIKKDYGE